VISSKKNSIDKAHAAIQNNALVTDKQVEASKERSLCLNNINRKGRKAKPQLLPNGKGKRVGAWDSKMMKAL
jgi:hypothetical protein